MTDFHIRPDCRLCYGPLTRVLDLPDTPLANEYVLRQKWVTEQDKFPLFLSRCDHCGHVQLPVVVNPERLFRDYAYQSGTSPVFKAHLLELAGAVAPDFGNHPDTAPLVADIASNDGTLLEMFASGFYRRLGIDPARNLAEQASAKGIDTITEFFTPSLAREIVAKHGKAHLITALNVCAHVDDLNSFMQGVAELLHEDGTFVMEVGYLPDVIERGLYRVIYAEHLSYHHITPLIQFLARHGLILRDVERVNTQGGSIRCTVIKQPPGEYTPRPSDRMLEMLMAESQEALDVSRLAERIREDKVILRATLAELKAQGKAVCGYGAPAQLTTTCYALGITPEDVAFIVDDNPLKIGKFTPGLNIPIVPTSELYERKPDACVIFSANFADDIMARHAMFSGEWITI